MQPPLSRTVALVQHRSGENAKRNGVRCGTISRRAIVEADAFLCATAPRILLTKQDDIAIVTLNRPRKYNALDMGMFDAIVRTVEELRIDRTVRVVLLRGEGKVFSAGLDFKSVASNPLNFGKLLKRPSGVCWTCVFCLWL